MMRMKISSESIDLGCLSQLVIIQLIVKLLKIYLKAQKRKPAKKENVQNGKVVNVFVAINNLPTNKALVEYVFNPET